MKVEYHVCIINYLLTLERLSEVSMYVNVHICSSDSYTVTPLKLLPGVSEGCFG